mgnify:FL=1
MCFRLKVAIILCFGFVNSSVAQQFGGEPSNLKWLQVNARGVNVIFPKGLDSVAQRIAAVAGYLHQHTSATAGDFQRKIDIVLHNHTTISNAYVGLAPWRSEFNLMPPQNSFDLGSIPWPDNLAIHEYRHVQQFMNYRKGLSKLMYFIFGEEGQAVANNAAIPNWFFEGDAVFQETSVSAQGRGRLPFFFNGYKSLWQAARNYSYMKLRNGSYRNYVPDHYQLGYLLVGFGREKFGADFWKKVTDDAVRYRNLFYPFQRAVRKYSGLRFREFVDQASALYKQESAGAQATGNFLTNDSKGFVTDYVYPYALDSDSVLVLKKSYRNPPAWYWHTADGEQKIRTRAISIDDDYAYSQGKIIYAAYEPDIRWGWRDYSVIRILDLRSGRERRVTSRSRYFAPDLSADGKTIVALNVQPDLTCELQLLDARNGKILQKVPNPDHLFYTYPRFFDNSRIVSSVRNSEGMMALALIDLKTGVAENLTSWTYKVNAFPLVKGDTVYFTASTGYRDEIFAVDSKSKNLFRLTNEELGAYQPALGAQHRLIFSNFTANGFRLKEKSPDMKDWEPITDMGTVNAGDLYIPNALRQNGGNALAKIPAGHYPVTKYSKGIGLFNFHSWRPYYDQPDWIFTVFGENILNTLQSSIYYDYNSNERSHKFGFDAQYAELFPWITGGISYTLHRQVNDSSRHINWNEWNSRIGFSIPLNFSKGRWYKYLSFGSSFNYKQVDYTGLAKDSLKNSGFTYLQSSLRWSSQTQKAKQNIFPHWAQTLYLQHRSVVNKYRANQFLTSASFYLPGFGVNQSLVVSAAFQARDTANEYRFDNNFPFARGYGNIDAPRMWKWSLNYHFPLCYPDWGFGQIVYFHRVRANIFYDNARAKSLRTGTVYDFRTLGAEIFLDTQWWNQEPVSIGFRYSRLLDNDLTGQTNRNVWEIVLPVLLNR